MKKKVSELSGSEIDYWVAKAEGIDDVVIIENTCYVDRKESACKMERYKVFNPRENWFIGGPIIEREGITTSPHVVHNDDVIKSWRAFKQWPMNHCPAKIGKTQLISGMMCFIASRIGEEVDI